MIRRNSKRLTTWLCHSDQTVQINTGYSFGAQGVVSHCYKECCQSLIGYFQVDDFEQIDLSDCDKQCELTGEPLIKVIDQFGSGNKATIRFHDYLVQEFMKNIPISNFAEGLQSLKEMQKRFN